MLEEELQVQLFIRGSKKIRLTEAGKALYVRAESLLTMTDITKKRGDQGQPGDDDSSGGDAVYGSYDNKISGQIYKKSSGYPVRDP